MDFNELRKCDFCDAPVAGNTRAGKSIDFHRLVVEHLLLNVQAINERIGLTMMLGGNERLADAMGSQRDAALPMSRRELMVCQPCWVTQGFTALHDIGEKGKELPIPETERMLANVAAR